MEKKSKFTKKLINLFWGFIGALPIIYFLTLLLTLWFTNSRYTINVDTWTTTDFNAFIELLSNYTIKCITNANNAFSFINGALSDTLNKLIQILINGTNSLSQNNLIKFVSYTLSWYIITQLIHIVVDFILLLPNICKRLFRKVGGDYE